MVPHLFTHILAPAQQHHAVLLEEEGVVDVGVSSSHGPLVDYDVL